MTEPQEVPKLKTQVDIAKAPMLVNRADGWRFFRDQGDVFQDTQGDYYITSYETIRFIEQNPKIFSSKDAFEFNRSPVPLIPLAIDPPDHVRYRRILDPLFSPRQLNPLQEDLRRQAALLIDAFATRGECDAMSELAALYPTQVFLTMFGLPLEDRDKCMKWVRAITGHGYVGSGDSASEVVSAAGEMTEYLRGVIEQKRRDPDDDVFSKILAITGEDAWSDDEMLGFAFLFTIAGLDTVTAALGFVMYYLATHPDVRRSVVADPGQIEPMIEEVLRMETVAAVVPRVTVEDVDVAGVQIPKGSTVIMVFGAANRDPMQFETPNEVDLSQGGRGHLTFGAGIHRCVGSHLARRELRIVVEEFHKRIPEYTLNSDALRLPSWPTLTLRYDTVPLVFERVTA